jgi:hypothetical protein
VRHALGDGADIARLVIEGASLSVRLTTWSRSFVAMSISRNTPLQRPQERKQPSCTQRVLVPWEVPVTNALARPSQNFRCRFRRASGSQPRASGTRNYT